MQKQKLQNIIRTLRLKASKHYAAALHVDQNRLQGFNQCVDLAAQLVTAYRLAYMDERYTSFPFD